MKTKEETTNAIIEYFKENEDLFNECIEELDGYNGYLGDERYYYMEELDELYSDESAIFVLQRAFYGRDDETWHTDERGEKHYGAFNPNREYFYFNGYGNLVSADYKDYSGLLDHYAIEAMQENRNYIDSISSDEELDEMFDALDALEEE